MIHDEKLINSDIVDDILRRHTSKSIIFTIKTLALQGLKSAIFQNGLGWLCPVSAALKNPLQEFKNSFCLGAINP